MRGIKKRGKKMEQSEIEKEWMSKYDVITGRLKFDLSNDCAEWALRNMDRTKELSHQLLREELCNNYDAIIEFLKEWIDIPEEQMKVIALWIIGTYFHKQFSTYPYLFLNAMRGSGKSRLLRIISWLQARGNGEVLNNPSEPVMFRTAQERGLIFDEFESQKSKDKQTMREYMNACYKEGGMVYRMEKQKSADGKEKQVAQGHPLFTPVALANISGIEDVLGDRSITLILEKSMNPYLVKKIENFSNQPKILQIKSNLQKLYVELCNVYSLKYVTEEWNSFVECHYSTTLHTIHTIHNSTTILHEELFQKIDKTGIFGRNLELFFPLLLIADMLGTQILDEVLGIVSKLNELKKEDEFTESRDVSLIEFVSQQEQYRFSPVFISELFNEYQMFSGSDATDRENPVTLTWFGSALKRLKLVTYRKRVVKGIMILLNIEHAKEKLKIFKNIEEVKV
jgi:hypothetical protein